MWRFVFMASSLMRAFAMRRDEHRGSTYVQGVEQLSGPPLCDEGIVQETCVTLNDGEDSASVTLEALQATLAATTASADMFWKALNFDESQSVPCIDLCQSTVSILQSSGVTVPDSSDVGCYKDDSEIVCDLPLDFGSIKAIAKTNKDLPNFHDKEFLQPMIQEKRAFKRKPGAAPPKEDLLITYPVTEAARRVANLFRIYPMDETLVTDGAGEHSALEEASSQVIKIVLAKGYDTKWGMSLFPPPSTRVKSIASKGVADRAGLRVNDVIISDPDKLRDDLKRLRRLPLKVRRGSLPDEDGPQPGQDEVSDFLNFVRDNDKVPETTKLPKWRKDLMQRNQQAQVYVTNALHKLRARQTQKNINKWFGSGAFTDNERRAELTRLLNSVDALLDNVEYVFPGPECKPNVYGYVYPRHPDESKVKDAQGKFIFYLCQLYVDSPPSVQIETLTHEGSHHATAFTTDVCADALNGRTAWPRLNEDSRASWHDSVGIGEYYDQKVRGRTKTVQIVRITSSKVITEDADFDHQCDLVAYGRDTCQGLARQNPFQAMRNADNLCYYVQDVTDDS